MQLERNQELTALVDELAHEHSTPGIGVGVLAEGRAFVATAGVTSTTDSLAVDEDTLFMIGSTSKTFTATALMALVDEGAVTLKDRVIDHVPGLRLCDEDVAQTVTIEQLLNHTSGWRGDLIPPLGWGEDVLANAVAAMAAAPQQLPVGQVASYSNAGFVLAGHLLATVRGSTFEQAVRELVIDPLGLTGTCLFPWEVAHRRHAVGHVLQDGKPTPVQVYPIGRGTGPAGGVWSSLHDQLTYARYHLDGSTRGTAPLLEESRLLMQQPTVAARSGIDGIGLSWLLDHHENVRLVSHGGNVSNLQSSAFVLAPQHDLAVVVLTNAKHGAAIGRRVQDWVLQRYLDVGPRQTLDLVPFDPVELAGVYDVGPFAWSLTATGGRLFLEMKVPAEVPEEIRIAFSSPAREIVAVGEDVFAFANETGAPILDVRRAADGSVDGIMHGLRFAARVVDVGRQLADVRG